MPTKIQRLLKNDVSFELVDIFNMWFTIGVFPSAPVHKNGSKPDFSNYRTISLLLNLHKIF